MDFPLIKDYNDNVINPKNLLLHQGENKLVFMNENNADSVFLFDLEKGKIV